MEEPMTVQPNPTTAAATPTPETQPLDFAAFTDEALLNYAAATATVAYLLRRVHAILIHGDYQDLDIDTRTDRMAAICARVNDSLHAATLARATLPSLHAACQIGDRYDALINAESTIAN